MCKIFLAVISIALVAPLDGGAAMLIAARASFAISRAKHWVNPYVADGLVAMWDGIWNAGGGRHTDDVAAIVPIVGTRRSLSSNFIVHPDGLYNATPDNSSQMIIDLAAPVVDVGTGPGGGSTIVSWSLAATRTVLPTRAVLWQVTRGPPPRGGSSTPIL